MRLPFVRAVLLASTSLALACGSASVLARHSPMHPNDTQTVTFEGIASGTVDRVELSYERYALSSGPSGEHLQTLAESSTVVKTCDPPGTVTSLTCSHTMSGAFPASSLIVFKATAWDDQGRGNSESYSFAAGTYPWPDDPIPIRLKGEPISSLDVVFIRDTDITESTFRSQLDEVVDLYFKYDRIKTWRGIYNFYYSGRSGNYEELCNFTNPTNMAQLTAVGDTIAILHQTNLRDCKSGNRFSSEIDGEKSLVHESGHALYGLMDEYCCDSSYGQQGCVPNLYSSLANCQGDASRVGLAGSDCTRLTSATQTLNFWRIDPTGTTGCMMGPSQHNAGSDFGRACKARIDWRVGKCLGGECMPSPECP